VTVNILLPVSSQVNNENKLNLNNYSVCKLTKSKNIMNHKTLKNLIVLESNVKIYIPGTIDINIAIDNSKFVDNTLKLLSDYFGGSTSYQALGCWNSVNNGLIKENITVCESYCKEIDLKKHIEDLIIYCEDLKKELNQENISLEVNNKLYFV
jgi:hypothetical protein